MWHASTWDRISTRGELAARRFVAAFEQAGKTYAVATIGEDVTSLPVEAAMEAGDIAGVARALTRP